MPDRPVRFGIMGCAAIAKKNARGMLRTASCDLVCVASRRRHKAEAWCAELGLRGVRCVEGYDALVADAEVDAVYVPLPTSLHVEWVVKLAEAGKHVLVEKPVARTPSEARRMIEACRAAGVALLDGTMFVHHARFLAMRRLFEDAVFWRCERVTAAFTFRGSDEFLAQGDIRTRADGDPLGCLGDVGWYCIRFALEAFGRRCAPVCVETRLRDASDSGVPFDMDVDVHFAEEEEDQTTTTTTTTPSRLLTFHCSFKHHFRQWVEAYSRDTRTNAARVVRCDDFVIPRREELCEFSIEEIPALNQTLEYDTIVASSKATVPFYGVSQEVAMFTHFAEVLVDDPARCAPYHDAVLLAQRVMDAAMASARNGGARTPLPP
mmetsp:Transcript_20245/g.80848  ORF Transcript_20245/g.80848 Transcript_20245/m.80848 type:complete len:378 (-) Transcript_20245:1511-2644(-)